ncbi:MAG TPA: hypothetical protein VFA84_15525 [Acidimicrobiales bacterium]|nr:hypothetical protein [Acidimicrobiales bacterium]
MSNEKNVLVMRFADPSKAFQALSEMKAQPGIAGAAVVERTPEGQIRVADEFTPAAGDGIAVGGAVGALVGVLAGPLGVLLGWSTGFLAGAAYDADSAADTDDGFTVLSKSIPPGANALIVEMTEASHAAADDVAKRLEGEITRLPVSEVETEVRSAQDAARRAAAEARRARRETRQAEFKQKLSSLGHHPKAS